MSREYEIRSLDDICARLIDPRTRDNFRKDFDMWMDRFCETADDIRTRAEATGAKFTLKHRGRFRWIDDGRHDVTHAVKVRVGIRLPWHQK